MQVRGMAQRCGAARSPSAPQAQPSTTGARLVMAFDIYGSSLRLAGHAPAAVHFC